jgi:hypothetical protein
VFLAGTPKTAISAPPTLRLVLAADGTASIVPDLAKGSRFRYYPIYQSDSSCILGLTYLDVDGWPTLVQFPLPLKYDGPSPEPTPDPKPKPDPKPIPPPVPPIPPDPPPPPVGKLWPIIIYESKDVTPAQSRVITSKAVADWNQAKGHHKAWVVDKDAVDEKNQPPASIKEYTARAKTLPFFYLVSETGVVVFEGPLPDEAGVLELLRKFGG